MRLKVVTRLQRQHSRYIEIWKSNRAPWNENSLIWGGNSDVWVCIGKGGSYAIIVCVYYGSSLNSIELLGFMNEKALIALFLSEQSPSYSMLHRSCTKSKD